jgi:hypothetical protein
LISRPVPLEPSAAGLVSCVRCWPQYDCKR